VVFTPAFAAPEQLLGQHSSTLTDVYGLGCLLFYVLSLEPPHRSQGIGRAQFELQVLNDDVRRVSDAATRAADDAFPKPRKAWTRALRFELDWMCAKALRRNPAERYPSVQALADDLRDFLQSKPIQAAPESWRYRATRFLRRNALASLASGIAVLGLLLGGTVAMVQAERARMALAEQRNAREFLESAMRETLPWTLEGKKLTSLEFLQTAEQKLDREFANKPVFRLQMYRTLDELYAELGVTEQRVSLAKKSIALHEQVGIKNPGDYVMARLTYADALRSEGKTELGVAELNSVEKLLDRYQLRGTLPEILWHQSAASQAYEAADYQDAIAHFKIAATLAEKSPDNLKEQHALMLAQESAVHYMKGDRAESKRTIEAALALIEQHQINTPSGHQVRIEYATEVMESGDYAKAQVLLNRYREKSEKQLGTRHVLYWTTVRNQAVLAQRRADYAQSIEHLMEIYSAQDSYDFAQDAHYVRSLTELMTFCAANQSGDKRFGDPALVDALMRTVTRYIEAKAVSQNERSYVRLAKLDTALARGDYQTVIQSGAPEQLAAMKEEGPQILHLVKMRAAMAKLLSGAHAEGLGELRALDSASRNNTKLPRALLQMHLTLAEHWQGDDAKALQLRAEFLQRTEKLSLFGQQRNLFYVLWADLSKQPTQAEKAERAQALERLRQPDGTPYPYRIQFGL
jgi:hypothetical protein